MAELENLRTENDSGTNIQRVPGQVEWDTVLNDVWYPMPFLRACKAWGESEFREDENGLPLTDKRIKRKSGRSREDLENRVLGSFDDYKDGGEFIIVCWNPLSNCENGVGVDVGRSQGGHLGHTRWVPPDEYRTWQTHICPKTNKILLDVHQVENECAFCRNPIGVRENLFAGFLWMEEIQGVNRHGHPYKSFKFLDQIKSICKNTQCILQILRQIGDIPIGSTKPECNQRFEKARDDFSNTMQEWMQCVVGQFEEAKQARILAAASAAADAPDTNPLCPVNVGLHQMAECARGSGEHLHAMVKNKMFPAASMEDMRGVMAKSMNGYVQAILAEHNAIVRQLRLDRNTAMDELHDLRKRTNYGDGFLVQNPPPADRNDEAKEEEQRSKKQKRGEPGELGPPPATPGVTVTAEAGETGETGGMKAAMVSQPALCPVVGASAPPLPPVATDEASQVV